MSRYSVSTKIRGIRGLIRMLVGVVVLTSLFTQGATTYTWSSTSDSNWNDAANWNVGGTYPGNLATDTAYLPDSTSLQKTVNISSSVSINQLQFSGAASSGYDVTTGAGQTLTLKLADTGSVGGSDSAVYTLNTSGTNTIDANIVLGASAGNAQAITVYRSGTTLMLNGTISSSSALSYVGYYPNNATIIVTGTNTYGANSRFAGTTGQVWVKAIGNSGTVGNLGAGTTIEFTNPTTLRYLGAGETTTKGITFLNSSSGGATIDGSGTGGLSIKGNVTATTAYAHTLTLKGDSTAITNAIDGNITDGAGTVSVYVASGRWTLSGTNAYSGTANRLYNGCVVNINSDTALGTGTWIVDSTVTIDNTSTGAVTLRANPTFGSMGTFTFTGTQNLNLGAGAMTLSPSETTMTVNQRTLTIGGNIGQSSTAKKLTKAGAGTLALSGTNTWSGTTSVGEGVLLLNSVNALPGGVGSTGGSSPLNIIGGVVGLGNDNFSRALGTGVDQFRWYNHGGGFAAYGTNRVVNIGGATDTMTWATTSFVPNGETLVLGASDANGMLDFQNPVSFGSAARTVQVNNGTAAIDARLSGLLSSSTSAGGLTKTGDGTLEVTAANTYDGTTTVSEGTLLVNNASGSGTGNGTVLVETNGVLGGTGAIGGATTVNGAFAPGGSGIGTLTVNSDVTFGAGARYDWEYRNGTGDSVTITGDLQLPTSATVTVTRISGDFPATAVLFSAGSLSGATDLTGWTVGEGYQAKIAGTQVRLSLIPPTGTIIYIH